MGHIHQHSELKNVEADAPVYLAAVLEYLIAEVMELAGNIATNKEIEQIDPRCIQLAFVADQDLCSLITSTMMSANANSMLATAGLLPGLSVDAHLSIILMLNEILGDVDLLESTITSFFVTDHPMGLI